MNASKQFCPNASNDSTAGWKIDRKEEKPSEVVLLPSESDVLCCGFFTTPNYLHLSTAPRKCRWKWDECILIKQNWNGMRNGHIFVYVKCSRYTTCAFDFFHFQMVWFTHFRIRAVNAVQCTLQSTCIMHSSYKVAHVKVKRQNSSALLL